MHRVTAAATCVAVLGWGLPASAAVMPPPPGTPIAGWSAVEIPKDQISAAVAALDGIIEHKLRITGVPGMSVAVVSDGHVVYNKGFGVADVSTGAPVDADTTFQLASVSKPISASVVASVIGRTDVSWTDPVKKYVNYFELSNPYVTRNATIGDMFAMRSGLPHQAGDDLAELGFTRKEIIQRIGMLPLRPFRAKYLYANYSLTAGAEAVAHAVGVPWEQLTKTELFEPLGMTRSTSDLAEFRALTNRATLHINSGGTWIANGTRDEQAQAPAGMVASSANDMAQWMIMQLSNGKYRGEQVIDAEALNQTRIPRSLTTPDAPASFRPGFYGYGTRITIDATGRVRYGHSGAFTQGASTSFSLLPSENLGIVVLTNGFPIGLAESVVDEFLDLAELGVVSADWLGINSDLIQAAIGGGEKTVQPANPQVVGSVSDYVGTYDNDFYGPVTVKQRGKGLRLYLGPKRLPIDVVPFDGTTFAFKDPDGNLEPEVVFERRGERVVGFESLFLRAPGQEFFTRRS